MIYLYGYKKCSTCLKAIRKLQQLELEYKFYDIVDKSLDFTTIERIHQKSNGPIEKLFNTRGKRYQELNLKQKLPVLSDEEKLNLLSTDGYLMKRPILESDETVIIGFDEDTYEKLGG